MSVENNRLFDREELIVKQDSPANRCSRTYRDWQALPRRLRINYTVQIVSMVITLSGLAAVAVGEGLSGPHDDKTNTATYLRWGGMITSVVAIFIGIYAHSKQGHVEN